MASPKELEWLELYLETGDAKGAVEHVFPDCAEHNRSARASQLKSKLVDEIDKRLREQFRKEAPQAFNIIRDLMTKAKQEAVQLKAAQDVIARGGFNPVAEHRDLTEKATEEELKAKLASILSSMGPETVQQLLGGEKGALLIQQAAAMAQAQDKTLDYLEGKIEPKDYN